MSLEGKLEDLGLSDIFQILNLSRRTGTLTIRRKEGKGIIVFNHGQVVYASIEDKKKLGRYLLESGVLSNESLEDALRIQKTSSPRKTSNPMVKSLGSFRRRLVGKSTPLAPKPMMLKCKNM